MGAAAFYVVYEKARYDSWHTYINEGALPDQRTEYWWRKHDWKTDSKEIESRRTSIISNYETPAWKSIGLIDTASSGLKGQSEFDTEDSFRNTVRDWIPSWLGGTADTEQVYRNQRW